MSVTASIHLGDPKFEQQYKQALEAMKTYVDCYIARPSKGIGQVRSVILGRIPNTKCWVQFVKIWSNSKTESMQVATKLIWDYRHG